jgi:ABC-type multidrug transport system fused ATPase/permease subunit
MEHSRALRPSILLNAYLFITLLFDISQVRTLWLVSSNADEIAFTRIFTCGVAVKALLIVLESQAKARWIVRWDVKEHSPEETTGLYGLGAYFWLNRLLLRGYRKVLEIPDLFPLDQNMAAETLHVKLAHHIDVSTFKGRKHGLVRSLAKALAVPLLLPVAPRIALGAFQFCQPFLIETLLRYLELPSDESSKNIGYGLIGATVLIYVGIAASGAFYWYFQERAMYMARGLLAKAIFLKTMESKLTASGDSAALTLMSTDIERVIVGCLGVHEFWANAIEIAIACWLLSRQIGPAFVAPLIVVGCCVVFSAILARLTGPRQKAWMDMIQKRVGLTSNMIGQMKHLKISGLSGPVEESIQSMRIAELKAGGRFRAVLVFSAVVGYTPLYLSPVITFAFAARTLDVTTIFTSISYILLLATPLGSLFQTIPTLLAGFTCFGRIQDFLEADSRFDFRELPAPPHSETSRGEKASEVLTELSATTKLRIRGGSFGWETDKLSLKNIDLDIPMSRLTVVVGPVASGKSTLCKAILGEVPVSHGQVLMASGLSRKIGYCDQTPYLSNATIRENIVGFSPFIQQRYDEVIEATMLRTDLALLPQGDNTKIGSNGITLSGGQKQRVSMARALYLESDFYVFDDILSGLDADTEEQVFLRVFSPAGLIPRRNATAVLCTHSIRHLPSADHIVALGQDGTIIEQGTFQELIANEKYVHSLGVTDTDKSDSDESSASAERTPTKDGLHKAPSAQPILFSKAEEQARMTGDWAVYRHYFARINTFFKVSFILTGISWGFFSNFGTIWLKYWSEDVVHPSPSHSNAYYNGLYAFFQLGTLLCLFFLALITMTSMIKISGARLHQETLTTVINAPLKFFTTTDTGVVINLFSQDMTLIDGQLPNALLNVVLDTFNCLGMAAVIATASPYLAITYPFLGMVLYGLQKFYLRTSRQMRLLDLEAKSPL